MYCFLFLFSDYWCFHLPSVAPGTEYKVVVINRHTGLIERWEERYNRRILDVSGRHIVPPAANIDVSSDAMPAMIELVWADGETVLPPDDPDLTPEPATLNSSCSDGDRKVYGGYGAPSSDGGSLTHSNLHAGKFLFQDGGEAL